MERRRRERNTTEVTRMGSHGSLFSSESKLKFIDEFSRRRLSSIKVMDSVIPLASITSVTKPGNPGRYHEPIREYPRNYYTSVIVHISIVHINKD